MNKPISFTRICGTFIVMLIVAMIIIWCGLIFHGCEDPKVRALRKAQEEAACKARIIQQVHDNVNIIIMLQQDGRWWMLNELYRAQDSVTCDSLQKMYDIMCQEAVR